MSLTLPLTAAAPAYAPPLPTAHPPLPRPTLQLARPGEKRRRISRGRLEEVGGTAAAAAGPQDRSQLAVSVNSVQDLDGLLLPWISEDSADPATFSFERDALLPTWRGAEDSRARLHRRGEGDSNFGPGDYGWGTDWVTETVTVRQTNFVPAVTTQYTTYGVTVPTVVHGGRVTISVYEGASTTITLTPNVVTYTIYPTATTFDTSTVTEAITFVETRTETFTSNEDTSVIRVDTLTLVDDAGTTTVIAGPTTLPPDVVTATRIDEPTPSAIPTHWIDGEPERPWWASDEVQSKCWRGDKEEELPGRLRLTPDQKITLYVIGIYLAGITLCWNLFFVRWLLYPFKTLTVAYHEFGHVLGIFISRLPLYAFTIDPNRGGGTFTLPGLYQPPLVLFLGQVTSIVIGGALIFCGFDTLASKYASFAVGVTWFPVVHFESSLLTQVIVACGGLIIIGLWFLEHATGLRYYILFIGVLSSFYILWDTMDDFLHRKENACCIIVMETNVPRSTARRWFAIWFTASLLVVVGCILAALAHWRATPHAMYCRGQSFLPT